MEINVLYYIYYIILYKMKNREETNKTQRIKRASKFYFVEM